MRPSASRTNDAAKGTTAKSESARSIGGRSKRQTAAENGGPLPTLDNVNAVRDAVPRLIADVYASSRVKGQKSYLLGIEAAEEGRFPELLIGSQEDTSLRDVFAPTEGRCQL